MTATMYVNLYATLRQVAGRKRVELDLPDGSTLAQVIQAIVAAYPAMRHNLLSDGDRLLGHVRIFVNGRDVVVAEQALERSLESGDEVDIFPAISGGTPGHPRRREASSCPGRELSRPA